MKILVVEDEPILREDIAMILEFEAHTVYQAQDGREALAMLSADITPDLIFTDVKMPHMTGLELIAALREGDFPNYPIIVCSAYAMNHDISEAEKLGVHKYITKPFNFDEIIDAAKEVTS